MAVRTQAPLCRQEHLRAGATGRPLPPVPLPFPPSPLLILGADSAARGVPCGSCRETVINPALFSGSFRRSRAQTRLFFLKGHKI